MHWKAPRLLRIAELTTLLGVAWIALFISLNVKEAKIGIEPIPPIAPLHNQNLMVDVVKRERDLCQIVSHWPEYFEVTNISNKNVTTVMLDIFAANDEGGPAEWLGWGGDPNQMKNPTPLLPGNSIRISIPELVLKRFVDNGKPFLYVQQFKVFVDNDPTVMYSYGAEMRQDPNDKNRYVVVVDAKGRTRDPNTGAITGWAPDVKRSHPRKSKKHNHVVVGNFHITHSVKPPFMLGCCTKEVLSTNDWTCDSTACMVSRACQWHDTAFALCDACCTSSKSYANYSCEIWCDPFTHLTCSEQHFASHTLPCNCCNCG